MSSTFDASFQTKIITLAFRDAVFLQRCEGLLKPEYFDLETLSYLADLANRHFETYRTAPDSKIVIKTIRDAKLARRIKDEFVDDLKPLLSAIYSPVADLSNRDYYVDEVSTFARQRALEAALLEGADILDKGGDPNVIEAKVREALAVGAHEGTGGRDFFSSVQDRIKARIARLAGVIVRGITTGHREIDGLLYHKGWGLKELYILMGAAKSGKSTGLQHFAIKAAEAGFKVLYTSHENSLEVLEDRMDAAISGVQMKDLDVSGPTIEAAVKKLEAAGGALKTEEFPAGEASVADLARVLRRFKAQGIIFDLIVCDYADELKALGRHQEERFKLKEIYTSLRALATTENVAILTATQTNRGGATKVTAMATDVGDDWSKMKIADGVITLNSTDEERKLGQMRLHFALMRNNEQGITIHCITDRSRMQFIKRIVKIA